MTASTSKTQTFSLKMWPLSISSCVVATVLTSLPAHCATLTFFDGTFDNSHWQISTMFPSFATPALAEQELFGGHGGAYREITAFLPSSGTGPQGVVLTYHKNLLATYDMSTQGSILSLDFDLDTRQIHGGDDGGWYGVALEQNGRTFYHFLSLAPETSWKSHSLGNLTQNDFVDIFAEPAVIHPDFSLNSAPISFGFFYNVASAIAPNTPEMTFISAADNWRVRLHLANDGPQNPSSPEPSFLLSLLGFAAVSLGCGLLYRK